MIQAFWFVGRRVGRTWLRETRRSVRAVVRRRWPASGAGDGSDEGTGESLALLRRLEAETAAVVERALAPGIALPTTTAGSRVVRLRAATVSHLMREARRIGIREDEADALAHAAPLREVDARLTEAMARRRDGGGTTSTPAFHRRLALLDVVSDASHPGVRSEGELEPLRRARTHEEVARRELAFQCVARLDRELRSDALASVYGPRLCAEARRLLEAQWTRLASAPLPSDALSERAEELAAAYRRHLLAPVRLQA